MLDNYDQKAYNINLRFCLADREMAILVVRVGMSRINYVTIAESTDEMRAIEFVEQLMVKAPRHGNGTVRDDGKIVVRRVPDEKVFVTIPVHAGTTYWTIRRESGDTSLCIRLNPPDSKRGFQLECCLVRGEDGRVTSMRVVYREYGDTLTARVRSSASSRRNQGKAHLTWAQS